MDHILSHTLNFVHDNLSITDSNDDFTEHSFEISTSQFTDYEDIILQNHETITVLKRTNY